MGSLSNYAENAILDHVLKTTPFSVPTNIYVALSTADPLDTGAGIAEPEGGGYERVICNSWDEAASRATANTADVVFPEATGDWGTITHVVLFSHIMFVMGFQRESIEMYLTDKNEKDNYTDSFKDEYSMTIKIYPKTP